MKAYRITAMAAAVLIMAAGCTTDIVAPQPLKPGSSKVFYATMESQTKTTIDRDKKAVLWEEADTIAINGIKYVAVQDGENPRCAMFVKAEEEAREAEPVGGVFYATYPSNLYDTVAKKAVLPAVQQYVKSGSLAKVFPMYAESMDEKLQFKNICGLLELNLTGDYTVKTITVTDAKAPLSGEFEVKDDNNAVIVKGEPEKGVTLDCGEGVKLDESTSKPFYIAVPAGEYIQLTITVTTDDDKKMVVKTRETAAKVVRNTIYPINNPKFMPPYLPGKFTVNASGKQVHFSPGNLTYNVSTTTWAFYEHQYDCATGYDANLISLFTWGYDATKSIVPDGTEYVTGHTTDGESFNKNEDWGYVFGGESSVWCTLSKDEWTYLFSNHDYKWATVSGVNGYVIAPDGFDGTLADSYADDAALAADNLVFLPVAGRRSGSDVYNVGGFGNYQSSSAYEEHGVYSVNFSCDGGVSSDYHGSRDDGYSVRLVTVIKAPEPEYVEIGGVKWATKNLGATTVAGSYTTCYGDLYQWGSVNTLYDGFPWTTATTGSFTWKNGKEDGFVYANREYTGTDATLPDANDVVKQKIGDGWRMPTSAEFKALYDACLNGSYNTSTNPSGASASVGKGVYWCTSYDGVKGLLFCDGTNKLFFPAAGYGDGTSLSNAGSYGLYWSSSLYTDNTELAYHLFFNSGTVNKQSNSSRFLGFSVRPVKAAAAPLPAGALAGEFSVSATKKVHFSQGNLVAEIDVSGVPTAWKFATNQYDCLGEGGANKTIGESAGDVDLFGWSTASTTYGISTSTTDGDYSGDFVDWGKNIGDGNTWCTLTRKEWCYLFAYDPDAGDFDTESPRYNLFKWGVTVCGKTNCLIIAPDNWDTSANPLNDSYNETTWATAEAAGLVCLPAAGYREGSNIDYFDYSGYYWSSTTYNSNNAYCVSFSSDEANFDGVDGPHNGFSVRLITECQ